MAFRPDAPAFNAPALLTVAPLVGLSTDDEPEVDGAGGPLEVGQVWQHEDTGAWKYWTGSVWKSVTVEQSEGLRLSLLFEIRDLLEGDE
jgi:hypothetical protein